MAVTGASHAEGAGSSMELLLRWFGLFGVGQGPDALAGPTEVGPDDDLSSPILGRLLVSLHRCQVTGDTGHLPTVLLTY